MEKIEQAPCPRCGTFVEVTRKQNPEGVPMSQVESIEETYALHQCMPNAPRSPNGKGASVQCDYHGCKSEASFIQNRRALCFVHASLPGRKQNG